MNREDFLRELRKLGRDRGIVLEIIKNRGKGSHYRVRFGDRETIVQSGELPPMLVKRLKAQLGID